MKQFTAALLLSVFAFALSGQMPKPDHFSFQGQQGPGLVPTSSTDLCIVSDTGGTCSTTKTVYVTSITLTNESATADTCFVQDKQATPRGIFGVSGRKESVTGLYIMVFPHRLAIGGLTWGCTNGTVTGYITYEY